jgi:tripartite-type tricarboxylate transporter receptor subunit TctC
MTEDRGVVMLRRSLLASPLLLAAAPARAQWVPKQPIKILVGYAPGGTADIAARIAAETIQRQHGYTVIVDNKTGAGGFIALKAVAQSAPDGYTVGIGIMGQLAVGPVVPGSQIPLDLDKELVPICNLVGVPMALIVRMDAPFKTIPELIAYAKANPGKVSYASTGLGSTNQLGAELFAAEAGGLKMIHVPYRGGAPAIADVASGNVDIFFANVSEIMSMARGGKVRVLALAARKPSPLAPELPLLTKDIPALDINNWFGLVGPAGLPEDSKASLAKMFLEAMADPKNTETLAKQGLEPLDQGPAAFAAYIAQDRERWAKVVKQGNIRAE